MVLKLHQHQQNVSLLQPLFALKSLSLTACGSMYLAEPLMEGFEVPSAFMYTVENVT